MKIFLCFLTVFLFALTAYAVPQQYQINVKFLIGGVLVSSPKMLVNAGEAAEIVQTLENSDKKFKMKLVATDKSNDKLKNGILMNFDIEYTEGDRTVKTSPKILAKAGAESSIEVNNENYKDDILLKVIATRK